MELLPGSPALGGYHFPPEWSPHRATWFSWPHKQASWPGKIDTIYPCLAALIFQISLGETVCINVNDQLMEQSARTLLAGFGVDLSRISFFMNPTNDAWCRDHGPAFLLHQDSSRPKVLVSWLYNAWGNKYPPYTLDMAIPARIAEELGVAIYHPGIVMEGGSVDFNGQGTVITTTSCLLNPNRNPGLTQSQIEQYLASYYGIEQVLWLGDGIAGDDTDGHIDDITRFVGDGRVITMVEPNKRDRNHTPLHQNLATLKKARLINGKQLDITEIRMPTPHYYHGVRLPASYANFYIANAAVLVPTFNDPHDDEAIQTLGALFPDRKVLGIDSSDLIWGLGSFHCLTQQEPV